MDNIVPLYTTTTGRISRKTFWLSLLALAAVNVVLQLLVIQIFGLGANLQATGWVGLIFFAIFVFPVYAIYVKRRHDKDNSGLDALIYLAIVGVMLLVQALGIGYSAGEVNGVAVMMPNMLMSIVGLVVLVYSIYMLVVAGFLKGTVGPNQYGPDPLGGAAPAAA